MWCCIGIDSDGNAHPDNAIEGDKRIYAYGHRNVQGLDFVSMVELSLLSMAHGTTTKLLP